MAPVAVESSIAVEDAVENRGLCFAFLFRACFKGVSETIGGLANGYFVNGYFELQFAREKQIFH